MQETTDPDAVPVLSPDDRGQGEGAIRPPSPWRLTALLWSTLVLLLGLAVAFAVHHRLDGRRQAEQTAAKAELARKSYAALQSQLQGVEALLRAVQTLFLASEQVTRSEFGHFYTNLHPRDQFPGLLALAYARREIAADGTPHYMTRWVEPRAGNEAVFGLDVAAQPRNMAGLLASLDADQATLSAPFRPVQPSAAIGPVDGLTMRLPIFSAGTPPATPAARRERVQGSIAVSFLARNLVADALPGDLPRELRLRIDDVTGPSRIPVFQAFLRPPMATQGYRFERRLRYGGRVWAVSMQPRDVVASGPWWSRTTLPAGLLVSVLLTLLVYSLISTRQRALELGWGMSRRYRESEVRFRALNELLPALVLLAEASDGRITYANRAARDRLGASVGERHLPALFEDPQLRTPLTDPNSLDYDRVDALLQCDNATHFWASVSITRIRVSGREELLMVATDISEQRELTELLGHQASHDALTELYNRREFERRLHVALAQMDEAAPIAALLYLDLDQFKLINDTSGHPAGDQLLAQLAIVMRKQLRNTDVLARLGGDEFGVLVTNVPDRAAAEHVAEGLRRCVDGYVFVWEQRSYTVSASIGGVLIDRTGILVKDLLAQADTACYMAKELGRNRVHFYAEGNDETVRRRGEMAWANRLRWAVDEQRLVLLYQEIWPLPMSAAGRRDIELLLRFRDESGQLVVPGVFMPAAERYGLMPLVDRWVIETALAHFDQLHPSGDDIGLVAINLSGASVENDSLAGEIIGWLRRYRVDPSRVCFEITETVAVRNLSQVVRFMERLRAAGCKTALDDFGAGMSSFTYLKNLPLDIIKIDGSFVRDMLTDPVSHLMVRAVTDMGHHLKLDVVAEWVTDTDTVNALTGLGVNHVQGFSLHHPEVAVFQREQPSDEAREDL